MRNKYLKIFNFFGVRNQMKKLNEEVYEFLEAVDNFEDAKADKNISSDIETLDIFRKHVIEEAGDVLNVMSQFIFNYDIAKPELDLEMDYKVERTLKIIKEFEEKLEVNDEQRRN